MPRPAKIPSDKAPVQSRDHTPATAAAPAGGGEGGLRNRGSGRQVPNNPVINKRRQSFFSIAKVEPELQTNGFLYTSLIIYIIFNIIVFFVGAVPEYNKSLLAHEPMYMRLGRGVARGSGSNLNWNSAIIIVVASRRLMTYLRSTFLNMCVPFDKAMPNFHSLVGNVIVYMSIAHTAGHTARYIIQNLHSTGFHGYISLAVTGSLLLFVVLAMRLTVWSRIRKKCFEVFYYTHITGFVLYYVLFVVHGSHYFVMSSWKFAIAPLTIYLIDRLSRLMRKNVHGLEVSTQSATIVADKIVCVRLPRVFNYVAGQYVEIKVPTVSSIQWHPFTIASSPHENEIKFFIKATGNWTQKLYDIFKEPADFGKEIKVHIRGPFGAPAQHVDQYEHIVLISGGVGATPFASIAKYAHHWILNYTNRGMNEQQTVAGAFNRSQSVMNTLNPGIDPNAEDDPSQQDQRVTKNTSRSNMIRNVSSMMARVKSNRPPLPPAVTSDTSREDSTVEMSNGHDVHGIVGVRGVPPGRSQSGVPEVVLDMPYLSSSGHSGARQHVHTADLAGFSGFAPGYDNSVNTSPGNVNLVDELGDPTAPVPDRRAGLGSASPSVSQSLSRMYSDNSRNFSVHAHSHQNGSEEDYSSRHNTVSAAGSEQPERIREVHSTTSLFSDFDEEGSDNVDFGDLGHPNPHPGGDIEFPREGVHFAESPDVLTPQGSHHDNAEVEDLILRDVPLKSNAADLIGVSMGSTMMQHLMAMDKKKRLRPSLMRASMTYMEEARESASWQERALFYLHTVTVNWFLLWIMLFRYCLAVVIDISSHGQLIGQRGLAVFVGKPLIIIDMIFALILAAPVLIALIFELQQHGLSVFLADSYGNMFDILLLLPLTTSGAVLGVLALLGIGSHVPYISKLTVFLFWPIMSALLLWRISRTIGSRILLAQYFRSTHATTRSLDFIWMSSKYGEDDWLVREMLPLAESSVVRLHRFLTSEKAENAQVEPWTLDYEHVPLKTQYGRPNWNEVFEGIAERSKSGSIIGVFCCGPNSMWVSVQQAAMRAMAKSQEKAYRVGYLDGRKGESRISRQESGKGGIRSSPSTRPNPAASHGCAIRFNLREEQFY